MPELPYFPVYAREELGDPALVTQRVEHIGALFLLRLYAWRGSEEPSLPDDEAVLAQWSRLGPRWPRFAAEILAQFSKKTDGKLYHSEWSRIWHAQLAKHFRRVAAGREGGIARAKLKQSPSNARAKLKQPDLDLELDRSLNGALRAPVQAVLAPEARASALEARAAPGAHSSDNGTPGEDSSTGRAVESTAAAIGVSSLERGVELPVEQEWRGPPGQPTTIGEVLERLRPQPGGSTPPPPNGDETDRAARAAWLANRRAAVLAEEQSGIRWVEVRPLVKEELVKLVARKAATLTDDQLKRVWISECVRAMQAARIPGISPAPEHEEVSP